MTTNDLEDKLSELAMNAKIELACREERSRMSAEYNVDHKDSLSLIAEQAKEKRPTKVRIEEGDGIIIKGVAIICGVGLAGGTVYGLGSGIYYISLLIYDIIKSY